MGDELRVTVIATGFMRSGGVQRSYRRPRSRTEALAATTEITQAVMEEFQPQAFDVNDLDIPAFLRRR